MSNDSNNRSSLDSFSSSRSPMERKNCLKRVLRQTLSLQLENDCTINKLDEAVNEADNVTNETSLQEKISNQQEVLIDSQMMTTSAKVLKTCTGTLTKKMRDYNYADFTQRLVRHLGEGSEESSQPNPNWSLLETRVMKMFRKIANYDTILGLFVLRTDQNYSFLTMFSQKCVSSEPHFKSVFKISLWLYEFIFISGTLEPLEKKVIVRKKPEPRLAKQAPMVVPDKVVPQAKAKDEDSVERTVRKIRKLIASRCKETRQPLDFFRLILHPQDFGRTVRNLLYISFLVKDGVVKLKKDNNGDLVVQPCRRENSQRSSPDEERDRTSIQNVISLNIKQWTILKEAYRLEEPMIDFDEEK
ncbi:EP300-interacting inhibitor of differentiation 3 isoform X2 [Ooceraea biroi]|uniref:EP300-interacting inhibitor of differentiation 3 isoform X2 n=1 Tax=Ooceraea biroi TaxID=2015173 RepID=UPI0005B902CC|nr:EP300-interacting inhibitor of differentiation 3 isoform X2 [Ooceraea biroi]